MSERWSADRVLELARGFQPATVLAAAVDLDLFTAVGPDVFTAVEAARRLRVDLRGLTILLDALAALGFLEKDPDGYRVPGDVRALLTPSAPGNVLAMTQHQANCLRRWAQLAAVIRSGMPAPRVPSVRGEQADHAAFIEAMDNLSAPIAEGLVREIPAPEFDHLLDVGGASGSWTIAWLKRNPRATATLFDLPPVIPMAEARLAAAGMGDRVTLVAGDYLADPLPPGADLAWVSAITHQNSRAENRRLFANVAAALRPGGHILIRDIVMEALRTTPVAGALFAVNMLVGTPGGGTYTFEEVREDLGAAGLGDVRLVRPDPGMNAVVRATKPR